VTTIPVAVVGTSFGGRVHVPALRAAGFEVVALVGRDPERTTTRARDLGVPLGTVDLAEALDALGDGPKAVTVSTPPDAHVEPVLAALDAGAHVICEKPFALHADDAQRMVHAAHAAGTVAPVGAEFRWAPTDALTARVVRSGAIGEPGLATHVQHSALLGGGLHPAFNDEWWLDADRGGGIINASAFHFVDRLMTWMGPVAAVTASVQVIDGRRPGDVEDAYTMLLTFASGATGLLQQCSVARGVPGRVCRVVGSEGSVWIDGDDVWMADDQPARVVPVPEDLAPLPAPPALDDPKHAFTPIELPPYTRLAQRFRDLILGHPVDPGAPPSPTFDEALAVQRVIDAARRSSADGGSPVPLVR
jgi:predicted dehydrogenase